MQTELRAHVAGSTPLRDALAKRGLLAGAVRHGLVVDVSASSPGSWPELEDELAAIFALTKEARVAAAPVVHVLHGPSLYGHEHPLRAMLATGLLGGARSMAAEGMRSGMASNAIVVDSAEQAGAAADAVLFLLEHRELTGQLIHCGGMHVGRPPA